MKESRMHTEICAEANEAMEKDRKYMEICDRAEAMGILMADKLSALMDVQSADEKFNMRLDEWIAADDFSFAHDFSGIQESIEDREIFPVKDFGYFVPRFAGRKVEGNE